MHKTLQALIAAAVVAVLLLPQQAVSHGDEETDFGVAGDPKKPAVLVRVTMVEETATGHMLFKPNDFTIRRGEQVRFVIENKGTLDHELIIGTLRGNLEHAEEMKKNPDMEHNDPYGISLSPNKRGEILWQFTRAGTFDFSCLIPGHREAGMHGVIRVR